MVTSLKIGMELKQKYYIIKNNIFKQKGIKMKFFIKIVFILSLISFITAQAESTISIELSTDNIENPSVLNTLGPVDILNLSGYYSYSVGRDVQRFKIISLPDPTAGILYLEDGETEVQVDQILDINQSNSLRFDPNPDFIGNATFEYASVSINDEVDPNPATVIIPVYAKETSVTEEISEENTTSTPEKEPCDEEEECCDDYDDTVPSLSLWGLFIIMGLTLLFVKREL